MKYINFVYFKGFIKMNFKKLIPILFFAFLTNTLSLFCQNKTVKSSLPSLNENTDSLKVYADKAFDYYNEGNFALSFRTNLEFLKIAEEKQSDYYIHKAHSNLGYDYLIQKDTVQAKNSFQKSSEYALLAKNEYALAMTYIDLGNILITEQPEKEDGYDLYLKSLDIYKSLDDVSGMVATYFNIIYASMRQNNLDKAILYIEQLDHILKTRDDYDGDICKISLDNIKGDYHLRNGALDKANFFLEKTIKNAEIKSLYTELENAYLNYSKSLEQLGDYNGALNARKFYEKYYIINNDDREFKESQMLANQYKIEQYQERTENAENEALLNSKILKSKNDLNLFLIIMSVLFFVFLCHLYMLSKKRRKLNANLLDKNAKYLKAKDESEKLAKSKSKFFSTVSHELRTPLYGVIGLTSILIDRNQDQNQEEDLKSLKYSADYLFREFLNPIIASFQYILNQNKNTIELNIDTAIPSRLKGNTIILSQILMNLIGNACKFTENGTISVNINKIPSKEDKKVQLNFSIVDSGIGIHPDQQHLIFEEFSQVQNNQYNYQGTGLGLPIVKKLIEGQGSTIHLESELEKGSTFSFELSFDILSGIEQIKTKQKTIIYYDIRILKGKHILIVDDNKINRVVTEKILSKNEVICDIAGDGNEAISLAKLNHYDIILMDVNMPNKNGIEASKEIREFNTKIPIIALTAVEIEEIRSKIYDAGMSDIIVKPYNINRFNQTIARHLSTTSTCAIPLIK